MLDWTSADRRTLLWRIQNHNYAAIAIGLLALALRVVYLQEMERHPFFEVPVAAEKGYCAVAEGAEWAVEVPLYAVWLRVLASVDMSPRVAQAFLGALSCILLSLIGRSVATPAIGNIAALALALYGPAIYFAGVLLPPILAGTSALALLWALLWADQSENRWHFVWPGAVMATTFHLAPFVVLLTPVVLWWLWRNGSRAECLAFAAGAVCVTAPSLFVPAIGFERFFAFDLIYGMAHGREYTAALDMYETRDVSSVLAILVWEWGIAFPFGLLLPLALLGLALAGGEVRGRGVVLYYLVSIAFGVLLHMGGTSEMRFVLVPALMLYAVVGMRLIVCLPILRASWIVLGIIAVAVGLNWPLPQAELAARASHDRWLGYAYGKLGMVATAIDAYEKATSQGIYDRDGYLELAELYTRTGRWQRAVGLYSDVVNGSPEDRESRRALGDLLMGSGRPREALGHYESLAADDDGLLGRLGDARLMAGQTKAALAAYEQLLTARPDSGRVRFQLARVYAAAGDTDEAEVHFDHLLHGEAWRLQAGVEWGEMLGREGDWLGAEEKFAQVLALEPDHVRALLLQGEALYAQARYEDALEPLRRLAEIQSGDWRVHGFLSKSLGQLGRKAEAQQEYERYQMMLHREEIEGRVKAEQKALGQMMKEDL